MHRLLIDGDALVWRATEANQQEDWWPGSTTIRTATCDIQATVSDILTEIDRLCTVLQERQGWTELGVSLMIGPWENQNFRRLLWPEYKTHRRRADAPVGMHLVRKELLKSSLEWNENDTLTVALPHEEADDVIGQWMTEPIGGEKRVLWSPDKDMLQIPGMHMDNEGMVSHISTLQGDYCHMIQTLTGDSSDGYPGCKGIGQVTAAKLLDSTDRGSWWPTVVSAYKKAGFNEQYALTQARVARILHWDEVPGSWVP